MSLRQYNSLHEFLEGDWENHEHKLEFWYSAGYRTINATGTWFKGIYEFESKVKSDKDYLLRDRTKGIVRLTIHEELLITFDGEKLWRVL